MIFLYLEILIIIVLFLFKFKNCNKIKTSFKYIKKGRYVSIMSNCVSCHTNKGSKPFSGGVAIKTPFGIIHTPNITPSTHGLKNLRFKEFLLIIKHGIRRNFEFLYPIFPFISYRKMKNSDLKSLFIFLRNLPEDKTINLKNRLNFPYNYRKIILAWRLFFLKFDKYKNYKNIKSSIKRGKYIIETMGHCSICHSKLNYLGKNFKKLLFSGGIVGKYKWYSNNLNNIIKNNIKKNDIFKLLKFGYSKKSFIFGPMAEVVNNSLQYVNKVDLRSMVNYITSLYKKKQKFFNNLKEVNFNKNYSKLFFEKGKIIYKSNCMKCHGSLMLGKYPLYPRIDSSIYNKFLNNINNMILYSNNTNTFKNFYASIMPSFINKFNFKEYFYIINYINFFTKLKKI